MASSHPDYFTPDPPAGKGGAHPDYFEPDAVPEAKGPDALESGVRGLASGASFGSAPALTGAGAALFDKLKGDKRDFGDIYRAERDDSRKHYEDAQKANPTAYGAGNLAGGLASGLALTPLTGGASLGGALGAGALAGGLQGAGEAVSKGEDLGQGIKDTASGAALGAGTGLLGYGGGKLAGAAIRKVAPGLGESLDRLAAAQGRRAIRGGTSTLSTKAAIPDEAVINALDNGGIKAFDNVHNIAQRYNGVPEAEGEAAMGLRGVSGARASGIAQGLQKEGVRGPSIEGLADTFSQKAQDAERNSVGSSVPQAYQTAADEVRAKAGPMGPLPEGSKWSGRDGNLDLDQAINIKRGLQDDARNQYGMLGGNRAIGDAKMDKAAVMRQAIEDKVAAAGSAAEDGSQVKRLAGEFAGANKQNAEDIAIGNASAKGSAQAMNRNALGPMAAGGGVIAAATGHPLGAAGALASQVLKNRGSSTAAVAARKVSQSIGKIGELAASNPHALGKYGGVLSRALAQSPSKFSTVNFILSKNDPDYQRLKQQVHDAPDAGDDTP